MATTTRLGAKKRTRSTRGRTLLGTVLGILLLAAPPVYGQSLFSQTLGGNQFWTDHLVHHGWRIQQYAWTGHYRLLDDKNERRAAGSEAYCRAVFARLRREEQVPDVSGKVVVVLHGLGRTRRSMQGMADSLREETGWTVLNMSYASTRAEVGKHAEALAHVIDALDHAEEIHFVAHSLGNLVIRHYLADHTDAVRARRPDPRIRRIVMLSPPNRGAVLAERWGDNRLFQWISGDSGRQVAGWQGLREKLIVPACEFAVIAGGRGNDVGFNPFIEGDDDLIVAVAETRLPGARDFLVVPCTHTTLMDHPAVRQATLRFLTEGHLRDTGERQPIEAGEE